MGGRVTLRLSKKCCVAMAFLAALSIQSAYAQDKSLKQMRQLYTGLANNFTMGENIAVPGKTYLVLMNPGVLIDDKLDLEKNDSQRYSLMTFADKVLTPNWIYQQKGGQLYTIYQNILTYAQLPIVNLSDDQKKDLKKAESILFKDPKTLEKSDDYLKWERVGLELATAQDDADDWIRNNPGMNPPASKVVRFQQALSNFNAFARADDIQAAVNDYVRLKRFDPKTYFASLQLRMDNPLASRTYAGQKYGTYEFYPTYKQWFNTSLGWTSYSLSEKDAEKTVENSVTHTSGGVSGGWGLWSANANYSKDTEKKFYQNEVSDYLVSGEFMRVTILRPWMEETLLRSDAWAWPKNGAIDRTVVSDGGSLTGDVLPTGQSPFLPVGFLVAKNVKLKGTWQKDLETFFKEVTSGGAKVGWGPFSFGGRTNSSNDKTYTKGNASAAEVSFATPQIIGVFVAVLDKSPNPNPEYNWGDNAQVPGKKPSALPEHLDSRALSERANKFLEQLKIKNLLLQ
ncbi:hypothetical protein [Rhodopseudomonas telluris]|uniref:Uncharacterized protein n=1 Tax=Rhodopseudomonas telluris TaxID=644215 RepID=A0ABV6EWT2_9BRAD